MTVTVYAIRVGAWFGSTVIQYSLGDYWGSYAAAWVDADVIDKGVLPSASGYVLSSKQSAEMRLQFYIAGSVTFQSTALNQGSVRSKIIGSYIYNNIKYDIISFNAYVYDTTGKNLCPGNMTYTVNQSNREVINISSYWSPYSSRFSYNAKINSLNLNSVLYELDSIFTVGSLSVYIDKCRMYYITTNKGSYSKIYGNLFIDTVNIYVLYHTFIPAGYNSEGNRIFLIYGDDGLYGYIKAYRFFYDTYNNLQYGSNDTVLRHQDLSQNGKWSEISSQGPIVLFRKKYLFGFYQLTNASDSSKQGRYIAYFPNNILSDTLTWNDFELIDPLDFGLVSNGKVPSVVIFNKVETRMIIFYGENNSEGHCNSYPSTNRSMQTYQWNEFTQKFTLYSNSLTDPNGFYSTYQSTVGNDKDYISLAINLVDNLIGYPYSTSTNPLTTVNAAIFTYDLLWDN